MAAIAPSVMVLGQIAETRPGCEAGKPPGQLEILRKFRASGTVGGAMVPGRARQCAAHRRHAPS
jgi:hypothetical protein